MVVEGCGQMAVGSSGREDFRDQACVPGLPFHRLRGQIDLYLVRR